MISGKTNKVRSVAELCQAFAQLHRKDAFSGLLWRAYSGAGGRAKVRIEVKRKKRILTVEPTLHPSRRLLDSGDAEELRLVLCPHLADALAADLRTAGINHVDLNGRLYLSLDDPPLLINQQPGPRRYANPATEVDVFATKSTRLTRALLTGREQVWTQEALQERCGVSRGLISRLLRALVAEAYLQPVTPATRQQAGTWRLADFDRLLDAWQARDVWLKRGRVQQYSVLGDDAVQTARRLQGYLGDSAVVFTHWFAANLRHPYTDTPVVSAYVKHPEALDRIPERRVSSGGNLWVIVPDEEGPLLETREVDGFRLVCDVQIYLDLLGVGQRGPDHAQALRQWAGFSR
jgi:hypothetical protein